MTIEHRAISTASLDASSIEKEALAVLLEATCIELMRVLDHVEESGLANIGDDPRFQHSNKVIGFYIMLRAGDPNILRYLPELREQTDEMRRLLTVPDAACPALKQSA